MAARTSSRARCDPAQRCGPAPNAKWPVRTAPEVDARGSANSSGSSAANVVEASFGLQLHQHGRTGRRDVDSSPMQMKLDPKLAYSTTFAALDPEELRTPRGRPSGAVRTRHLAFGAGPHRAPGRTWLAKKSAAAIAEFIIGSPTMKWCGPR